jgi:multiple sugar transport system substrate-binding protein
VDKTKPTRRNAHRRSRAVTTSLASLGVITATVAGGGLTQPASASGKQTVTFWEFQTDAPSINAFKASIKSFEALHPSITVQMETVPWSEQAQKLTTALATGGEPDVSMMGNDIVAEYVAEHQLLPLNLTNTGNISAGDRLYYHLDGKWWAVPLIDETRALLYNKSIFKAAGLSSPPATWAQMVSDAKTIKAKTGKVGWLAPMAKNDYDTVQIFMSVYLGYGARYLTSQGSCGFNTSQFKQALTLYTSVFKDGLDYPDATVDLMSAMFPSQFVTGKAGMEIADPDSYYELKTTNPSLYNGIGVAPVPGGPAGRFGFLGGWPLVVWKAAATQGVQSAAEQFAEYVGSSGGGDTALGKATGLVPANVQAAKQAPWNTGGLAVFSKQIATDAFPYQYPHAEIPQMGGLETDTVQTAVQSVALGTATVGQATSTLCSAINSAVGK